MKYIVILFVGFLLQTQFISFQAKHQYVEATILKSLASLCFVLVGLLSGNGSLIVAAQFAGMMGDIFLEVRRIVAVPTKVFTFGVIFFTVQHVVLIISSIMNEPVSILPCLIGGVILFAVLVYIIKNCLNTVDSRMRGFGLVYMLLLSCMCVFSLNAAIVNPNSGNIMFAIGAIFFVSSDTILVHSTFGKDKKWMHPTSLIFYYIAQTMISLSLVI